MTDEEILERLGEIERGRVVSARLYSKDGGTVDVTPGLVWSMSGWNPLTNDAQAMGLMRKHEIDVRCNDEGNWSACVPRRYGHYPIVLDADLNRAIAMAVVVAHGGGDVDA